MPSTKRRESYLMIDNRWGPGVSHEFAAQMRAHGKECVPVPGGQLFECATKRCCHCGTQVILNPDRSRPRGYCRKCDDYVCDKYECNAECNPFQKAVDDARESIYKISQTGLLLPK